MPALTLDGDQRDGFIDLDPGAWDPAADPRVSQATGPMLVVEGVVFVDVRLLGHVATELLGPGDLFPIGEPETEQDGTTSMSLLSPARVYVFDGQLERIVAERPAFGARVVAAAAEAKHQQVLHRALSQLPRVEDRVLGILWSLARRWGVVGPAGVTLDFEGLTHEMLGRLIGAKRATVTMAVIALEERGALRREGRRYVLDRGTWPAS